MTDLEIIEEIFKENSELKNVFQYKTDKNNNVVELFCDCFYYEFSGELWKKIGKFRKVKIFHSTCKKIDFNIFKGYKELEKLTLTVTDWKMFANSIKNLDNIKYIHILSSHSDILPIELLKELNRLKLSINDNSEEEKGFKTTIPPVYPPKILTNLGFSEPYLYLENYRIVKSKNDFISQNIVADLGKYDKKNNFNEKFKPLPDTINQFYIKDFHDIEKIHIRGISNNTQWIFLTGENGYGKTSILQAIVISLLGKNEDEGELLDKNKTLKSFVSIKKNESFKQYENYISNIVDLKNNLFQGYVESFFHFAAYGAVRINKSADRKPKTYSLFHNDGTLLDIEAKLREWYESGFLHNIYEKVRKIFLELLSPYIDDIKVDIDKKKSSKTVKYHEKDSKENIWLEYDELASGYKSIISTFGDMIIRLTESIGAGIDELYGIVLIDEFDLHLHPIWQKELVEKLTRVFPKIQFIVSTHSPIPILGAPENSIIINVDRDKENGITAKILDVDFKNLTPNSILTSPIFNFYSIIPESNNNLKELRTEDNYNEVVFNKILDDKLKSFIKQNEKLD